MSLTSKYIKIIVSIALAVRILLGWAILSHNNYNIEKSIISLDDYYEMGENIINGNGFSSDTHPPFTPNPIRVPIYPYFLATILWIFKSRLAIAIIQGIISTLIPIFSYLLVRRIFTSPTIAFVTGLFLAIEPFTALVSITMLTETIFTVFWLLFIYFFFDFLHDKTYKSLLFSGLFFGIACLTRPNILLLFIFTIGFIWWRFRTEWTKELFFKSALWGMVIVVIISPWIYRNYRTFNKITFSAHISDNLYLYLVPSVLALEKKIPFEQARTDFYAEEGITDINDILKPTNSQKYTQHAISILSEHPVGLIKTLAKTMISFFIHDGYVEILERFDYAPHLPASFSDINSTSRFIFSIKNINTGGVIIVVGRLFWIFITISCIFGVVLSLKKYPKNYAIWWALCAILYFAATTLIIGLGINSRFRFGVNPFIIMFAVYAWHSLLTRPSKKT